MDNTPFEEVEVVPSLLDEVSEFGCTHEENVDMASEMIVFVVTVFVVLVAAAAVVLVEQAAAVVASFKSSLNKSASFVDIPGKSSC